MKEMGPQRLGHLLQTDYKINNNGTTKDIMSVISNRFGKIKYKAIKLAADAGLVLGGMVKIWTHQFRPQILNIVHIHVNDIADEVTLDVRYLTE